MEICSDPIHNQALLDIIANSTDLDAAIAETVEYMKQNNIYFVEDGEPIK